MANKAKWIQHVLASIEKINTCKVVLTNWSKHVIKHGVPPLLNPSLQPLQPLQPLSQVVYSKDSTLKGKQSSNSVSSSSSSSSSFSPSPKIDLLSDGHQTKYPRRIRSKTKRISEEISMSCREYNAKYAKDQSWAKQQIIKEKEKKINLEKMKKLKREEKKKERKRLKKEIKLKKREDKERRKDLKRKRKRKKLKLKNDKKRLELKKQSSRYSKRQRKVVVRSDDLSLSSREYNMKYLKEQKLKLSMPMLKRFDNLSNSLSKSLIQSSFNDINLNFVQRPTFRVNFNNKSSDDEASISRNKNNEKKRTRGKNKNDKRKRTKSNT